MDEMRAMLDQLMGQDRNLGAEERKHYRPRTRSYRDKDVCKYYLCGFCPYEEFRRTKNDCGDCPCVHDEDAKREWDALDERSKERTGYEEDLKRWMDRLLVDLRKRIDANTERLRATEKPLLLVDDQQRLDALSARIGELLSRAGALGEEGDVDGAQQAMAEAEQVKVQRGILEQQAQGRAGNNATKNLQQAVCPISGLIINNEESRIKDHESGRNFNSWRKMHEVYARLTEDLRRREGGGRGRREGEGERGRRDERDRRDQRDSRPRERDRDRERDERRGSSYREDRGREERGSRDRERDRDYRSSRDRDYRDRDRDRGQRRERERSPTRPSRPRVDEADFRVEYTNGVPVAAAIAKQQQAAPGNPAQAQAPDWGVDYGPAKPY